MQIQRFTVGTRVIGFQVFKSLQIVYVDGSVIRYNYLTFFDPIDDKFKLTFNFFEYGYPSDLADVVPYDGNYPLLANRPNIDISRFARFNESTGELEFNEVDQPANFTGEIVI